MPETLITVDLEASPQTNDKIHNRWHPDIPIVEWVEPGADFIVEAYDWTGSQIKNDDDAADVRDVELPQVHYLSGPIGVKGAEPGDLLIVDFVVGLWARFEVHRNKCLRHFFLSFLSISWVQRIAVGE
jgi:formamidase